MDKEFGICPIFEIINDLFSYSFPCKSKVKAPRKKHNKSNEIIKIYLVF